MGLVSILSKISVILICFNPFSILCKHIVFAVVIRFIGLFGYFDYFQNKSLFWTSLIFADIFSFLCIFYTSNFFHFGKNVNI